MPHLIHCLAIVAITSTCLAQSARDKELASKLVGTWIAPPKQYRDASASHPEVGSGPKSFARTFRADGTSKVSAVLTLQGHDVPLHWEGTWTVRDGVLVEKITKCDHPEVTPIGTGSIVTLVSVTDSVCRFRTKDGQERYYIRKRD
jgi:hypothetical protein